MEAGLVDEIDDGAVTSIEKSGELTKVWRGHVVVNRVVVPVIGQIERVETKTHMVALTLAVAQIRNVEQAIDFHVQCEISGKALPVWSADIVLQGVDIRIRLAGV